jgi:hypothetical protein
MARHAELFREGLQADRADRVTEAALLFRSAALAALEFGDRAAWFKGMVRAAYSTSERGDIRGGLALLLEARLSEPRDAPEVEAWMARTLLFIITRDTRPERPRLEQLLGDLRSYATTHSIWANEVPVFEASLSGLYGDWRTALACYETGWQATDGQSDRVRSYCAYRAAEHCLRLGQLSSCRDWISALDQCKYMSVPRWSAESLLLLAQAEGKPFSTLLSCLRSYADRATDVPQRADTTDVLRELITRTHLLDPNAGDPAADFHPSRAELRRKPRSQQDVHCRYDVRLLYLDYRLACLRHVAGVPPAHDVFYQLPQRVPTELTPAYPDEFQGRLRKARTAVASTLRYARRLDNLLECSYREREVQDRRERIEEIARAVPS